MFILSALVLSHLQLKMPKLSHCLSMLELSVILNCNEYLYCHCILVYNDINNATLLVRYRQKSATTMDIIKKRHQENNKHFHLNK